MDAKDEIKSRVDIVDYISTYVRLKKAGKNWQGLCPFHNEKTPSFNVSRDPAIFKCFGCGAGGDVFSFVMRIEGLTFREALERLAEKTGVALPDRPTGPSADKKERARAMHAEAASFYAENLWNTPEILDYARGRGLSDATLRDFQIGWAPDEWESLTTHLGGIGWTGRDLYEAGLARANERGGFYDAFRGRLMFPIADVQGRVIAFGGRIVGDGEPKYLNTPESPLFFKSGTLYALNKANKAIAEQDRVLVMEGYMDVIATHQAGFPIAVATLGTSLTEDHVAVLARKTKNVVLAYDADSAGVKAALRAAPMFEEAEVEVRLLALPAGHDPDTYIKEFGPPAFGERIENAVPLMEFQLRQLRHQFDMDTDEGRTSYIRAAIPALAAVRSNVQKDRYVRLLAEEWSRDDMTRVGFREEDIRRDMAAQTRRMMAERRARYRAQAGVAPAPSLAEMDRAPEAPPAPPVPSGLGVKERLVLRALLQEPELARPHNLSAEEFTEGPHRSLAALALARLEDPSGPDPFADLSALPEPVGALVTDLSLTDGPPLTAEDVADNVERLRTYARQRRLRELNAYIQPLLTEGRLKSDDPLYQEWRSLQSAARYSDAARVETPG